MHRFNFLKRNKDSGAASQSPASGDGKALQSPPIGGAVSMAGSGRSKPDLALMVKRDSDSGSAMLDDTRSVSSMTSSEMEAVGLGGWRDRDAGVWHASPAPDCEACANLSRTLQAALADRAAADRTITELKGELFRIQAASPMAATGNDADPMVTLQHELSNAKVQLANAHWQMESKVCVVLHCYHAFLSGTLKTMACFPPILGRLQLVAAV